ncbi:hypothetical protein IWW55_000099 [Coemansia sp. RSA 2706]|nr:hypothetical protein IWW55_000099 [Coemansia sp. RSA 2706]
MSWQPVPGRTGQGGAQAEHAIACTRPCLQVSSPVIRGDRPPPMGAWPAPGSTARARGRGRVGGAQQ